MTRELRAVVDTTVAVSAVLLPHSDYPEREKDLLANTAATADDRPLILFIRSESRTSRNHCFGAAARQGRRFSKNSTNWSMHRPLS